MRHDIVSYLRFAGFSAAALAVAAFVKLAPAAEAMAPPEPLQGDPPAGQVSKQLSPVSQSEKIEILETELKRIDAEIANLRKALEIMGPLPDHPELFIPADPSREKAAAGMTPDPATTVRMSELYAPAPTLRGAKSLFYEAELGSFRSKQAAEADWRRLARTPRLTGMTPRYTTVGAETRLTTGPLGSQAAVNALCVELSGIAGACRAMPPVRAY